MEARGPLDPIQQVRLGVAVGRPLGVAHGDGQAAHVWGLLVRQNLDDDIRWLAGELGPGSGEVGLQDGGLPAAGSANDQEGFYVPVDHGVG